MNILLVEDDEAHLELMTQAFRERGNPAQLAVATTVAEAVEYLAHNSPDIVVTDLLLPDGEGTQLLPRADADRRYPIIVVSSYGDAELAAEVHSEGAVYYVEKSLGIFTRLPDIVERAVREWRLRGGRPEVD